MWQDGHFRYNTAVSNVNKSVIHNTYVNSTVVHVQNNSRVSFNGPGGQTARPNATETAALHEHHVQASTAQTTLARTANIPGNKLSPVAYTHPKNLPINHSATTQPQNQHNTQVYNSHAQHAPIPNSRPVSPAQVHNPSMQHASAYRPATPTQVHGSSHPAPPVHEPEQHSSHD